MWLCVLYFGGEGGRALAVERVLCLVAHCAVAHWIVTHCFVTHWIASRGKRSAEEEVAALQQSLATLRRETQAQARSAASTISDVCVKCVL